jgi:hypothetical protein
MSFLKQSALVIAAWNISSAVTWFQAALARAIAPEWYDQVMDVAGAIAVPVWNTVCQLGNVCWELLTNTQ